MESPLSGITYKQNSLVLNKMEMGISKWVIFECDQWVIFIVSHAKFHFLDSGFSLN